jgi:hypothetical protein
MFIEEKHLLKSKAILGALIAFVPAALEVTNAVLATGALPPKVAAAVSGFGALLAFFGRLSAKAKIR